MGRFSARINDTLFRCAQDVICWWAIACTSPSQLCLRHWQGMLSPRLSRCLNSAFRRGVSWFFQSFQHNSTTAVLHNGAEVAQSLRRLGYGLDDPRFESLCRSQWPSGLRRVSAATRLLGLWVRIPSGTWMLILCCRGTRDMRAEYVKVHDGWTGQDGKQNAGKSKRFSRL